jgi:outer membrane protein assembly factor BamB
MEKKIIGMLVAIVIVILFIFPTISSTNISAFLSSYKYNIYHQSDKQRSSQYIQYLYDRLSVDNRQVPVFINEKSAPSTNELIDSPWPMYCHDIQHTGRSPYSAAENQGNVKWIFQTDMGIESSAAINTDGTIYIGSNGCYILALNPNGTEKWRYPTGFWVRSDPAIAEDGTIYVGCDDHYFYALYPNGTLKWKFNAEDTVCSSPAIANDGTIYFGVIGPGWEIGRLYALHPNGTVKWYYDTSEWIYSSPAIDKNGTIYFTSNDHYLYALYPNGTLKWRYGMGDLCSSPSIADDGTIYFSCWDGYLHAVWPNGTRRWIHGIDWGSPVTPTIDTDGTIYTGQKYLYAVNPDGTRKWTFEMEQYQEVTTSIAISADGTLFFGSSSDVISNGYLYAVSSDGIELWKQRITNEITFSNPAIGEDGTIYIGTNYESDAPIGLLFAIGSLSPDAPTTPEINGEVNGKAGQTYDYTFTSLDPTSDAVYYYIEWGDGGIEDWIGPYASGETITISHSWSEKGDYTIQARAKDFDNNWGPWGELEVTMPHSYEPPHFHFIQWLLGRFLHAFPILRHLIEFV